MREHKKELELFHSQTWREPSRLRRPMYQNKNYIEGLHSGIVDDARKTSIHPGKRRRKSYISGSVEL